MGVKKLLKPCRDACANAALTIPPVRRYLNRRFNKEREGRFITHFLRHFGGLQPTSTFDWTYVSCGKPILIPVSHDFPRSWPVAFGTRCHEPHLIRFFKLFRRYRPTGTFFDVGANYGYHSYPFLAHGYQCVLFEPQPECTRFIRKVASRNKFDPRIEERVLCNAPGEIEFFVSRSTWFSSISAEAVSTREEPVGVTVQAETLDRFCESSGVSPHLVKIDVEGAESLVLGGARETIDHRTASWVMELWREPGRRAPIFQTFADRGYRCFAITDHSTDAVESAAAIEDVPTEEFLFTADEGLITFLAASNAMDV